MKFLVHIAGFVYLHAVMRIKEGFSGERSLVLPRVVVDQMEQDPVMRQLLITDIGYYPHAMHHYRRRDEPISQYVFIYCIDGAGWYRLRGRTYRVARNQYFVLPPVEPHEYGADDADPWTIHWAHFRGDQARHVVADDLGPQTISPSADSRIANRIALFEEVFNTLYDSLTVENTRYAISAFHYFLESLHYFRQYRRMGMQGNDADIVKSTIHYMEENTGRHLTIDEIAASAGMSPSYLSARFRAQTGYAPLSYFNMLKIRRACRLLDTTPMRLNQISASLGFDDPLYFSRLFTKIMGLSPRAYRRLPKT